MPKKKGVSCDSTALFKQTSVCGCSCVRRRIATGFVHISRLLASAFTYTRYESFFFLYLFFFSYGCPMLRIFDSNETVTPLQHELAKIIRQSLTKLGLEQYADELLLPYGKVDSLFVVPNFMTHADTSITHRIWNCNLKPRS